MKIQAYSDGVCRVFEGNNMLLEFSVSPPLKKNVDEHLKLIRMKRRERWQDYPHESFSEARVRFITNKR